MCDCGRICRQTPSPLNEYILFLTDDSCNATAGNPHCVPCFMYHMNAIKRGTGSLPTDENIKVFKTFLQEHPDIALEI